MRVRYVRLQVDTMDDPPLRKQWQVVVREGVVALIEGSADDPDLWDALEMLDELVRAEADAERGHP